MSKTTFVVLSFEGPDRFSQIGGLATRVIGLAETLAALGFQTHQFFIGDPDLPGYEVTQGGRLHLHRWCQWLSRQHRGGPYDGEADKVGDWGRSLPRWLESEVLRPAVASGERIVILAEEWQTVATILDLRVRIERNCWQDSIELVWNANNTYGFHTIDWTALRRAASITTVSHHMRQIMLSLGVDAAVVPNGISDRWFEAPDRQAERRLAAALNGRPALCKVGRWHPDKSWAAAIAAVTRLKAEGMSPILLARGGDEPYGADMIDYARANGLAVGKVRLTSGSPSELGRRVGDIGGADVALFETFLSREQRMALFRGSDCVLANSRFEPFGLVGLETMAVGGVAVVGATGEDYAISGFNSVRIQTNDPAEIAVRIRDLLRRPSEVRELRRAARRTARAYEWGAVIRNELFSVIASSGGG